MNNNDRTILVAYRLSGIMSLPPILSFFVASDHWAMILVVALFGFSLFIGSRSIGRLNYVYVITFLLGYLLAIVAVWLYKENNYSIALLGLVGVFIVWQYIFDWLITEGYISLR